MRASEKELQSLGPLVMEGRINELQRVMTQFWPPNLDWDQDDVSVICKILMRLMRLHGERAEPVYRCYATRLREAGSERWWLGTLWIRTNVIADFEGQSAALEWLSNLLALIQPPDVGMVRLVLGRYHMIKGDITAARAHLREAVSYSLSGIQWYALEAFSEMGMCLARLGDHRLAFEYMRSYVMESYLVEQIQDEEVRQSLEVLAAVFGQIDYWVELNCNFADYRRNHVTVSIAATVAANLESQAGFRLGQIGAIQESVRKLLAASHDATQGNLPSDKAFAITCRHLARIIDPTPLQIGELDQAVADCETLWLPQGFREVYSQLSTELRIGSQDGRATDRLLEVCRAEAPAYSEKGVWLNSVQVCALVGRYYRDCGELNAAAQLWRGIIILPQTGAIFTFVTEWLAELLITLGRPGESLAIAQSILNRTQVLVHERCVYRGIAARSQMALNQIQEAFADASLALVDWTRVLDGLYVEEHKIAWLTRADSIIRCAIHAIRQAVPWMDEERRLRELFRLTEIAKARILTDMVARQGYELGAFTLQEGKRINLEDFIHSSHLEWVYPLLVQYSGHYDFISRVIHKDDGTFDLHVQDVDPLKYAVQLPISPERRLIASAASLCFDRADVPIDTMLFQELLNVMPRHQIDHGS